MLDNTDVGAEGPIFKYLERSLQLLCVRSHAYIPQRDFCRGQSETVARMVLCLDNAPLLRQRYVTERRRKRGESSWTCVWGQTVKAARHARFAQNDFL